MGKLRIDGGACLVGAVLLLILPLDWLLAAVIAATVHELCHLFAIKAVGCRIRSLTVGSGGAVMETEAMSRGRELICALAGPAGSLVLLLFVRWIPRIALCAAVQGIFNLLPVFPLDGGRAVRCGAEMLFKGERAGKIVRFLESACMTAILLAGITLTLVYRFGLVPVLFALILTVKAILRKIPCKPAQLGVQ